MKRMIFTLLSICSAFSIDSCNTKELNLIGDNPVELSTDIEGSYFTGDPLQAKITLEPKHLGYAMDYFISYEQDTGEGVYKIEEEIFTTDNVHTITNDDVVTVAINFESANEGVHRSKWSVRNSFDQVTAIDLEFNIKKKPNTDPEIDTDPEDDEDDIVVIVAADDTATSADGASVLIDVLANDTISSEDILGIKEIGAVKNGIAVLEDNKIRYTPTIDFSGSETISYMVTDSKGNESSAIITIDVVVTTRNEVPVAIQDSVQTINDTPVVIDVLRNDTDNENEDLTLVSVVNSLNGSVEIEDQKIRYDANVDFVGIDRIEYTITDESGNEALGIVLVAVLDIPILNIVSAKFEQLLVENDLDTDRMTNGKISLRDAEAITVLNLSGLGFNDLRDIAILPNILELDVSNNELTFLDVSKNTKLKTLLVSNNKITNFDISNNPDLEVIDLSGNIDLPKFNAEKSTKLRSLSLKGCSVRKFDSSIYKMLELLDVSGNSNTLTKLDLTNNINLLSLNVAQNYYMTVLDLTNNTKLISLNVNSIAVEDFDISKNTALEIVSAVETAMKKLDLTHNSKLITLELGGNLQLTTFLLKNSENTLPMNFKGSDFPYLNCIEVNNVLETATVMKIRGWNVSGLNFSENCGY